MGCLTGNGGRMLRGFSAKARRGKDATGCADFRSPNAQCYVRSKARAERGEKCGAEVLHLEGGGNGRLSPVERPVQQTNRCRCHQKLTESFAPSHPCPLALNPAAGHERGTLGEPRPARRSMAATLAAAFDRARRLTRRVRARRLRAEPFAAGLRWIVPVPHSGGFLMSLLHETTYDRSPRRQWSVPRPDH